MSINSGDSEILKQADVMANKMNHSNSQRHRLKYASLAKKPQEEGPGLYISV